MSQVAQVHHHARVAWRDGLPLDDAITRCAEHFPDAEHDLIRELTRNVYHHEEAKAITDEQAREDPARLSLDGLPEALHEPILMVVQAPAGEHRVRLEALGESEPWRIASTAIRVDAAGRILRRLRSEVSPDMLTATLGTMDRRSGGWRSPAGAATAVETEWMRLSDVAPGDGGDTPTPILRGLAWPGRFTLLHAREKRGKSTLIRLAAASLSRGGEWLAAPTVDGGGDVAFVSEEHPADLRRLMGQAEAYLQRIVVTGPMRIARLRSRLPKHPCALLVIDTLTAFAAANGVRDLHGAGDLAALLADTVALGRETNTAIVVLHHNRKNPSPGSGAEEEYRDSTAIGAVADQIVSLELVDHAPRSRRLVARGRWTEEPLTVTLGGNGYAIEADDARPESVTAAVPVRPTTERILIHLSRMDPDTRLAKRDCAKALGYQGSSTYRSTFEPGMFELIDQGLIDLVEGKGGRNSKGRVGLALTAEGRKSAESLKPLTAPAPVGVADRVNGFQMPENIGPKTVDTPVNGLSASTVSGGAKVEDPKQPQMDESDAAEVLALVDAGYPLGDDAPAEIRRLAERRKAGETLAPEDIDALVAYVDQVAETLIQSGEVTEADGEDYAREIANGKREIVTSYSPPEGADPHRPTCPEDAQAWLRLHGSYIEGRGHVETGADCQIGGRVVARLYRRDNAIILEDPLGEMAVGPRALRWAGMPDEMIAALARGCELRRGEFGEWRDASDPGRQFIPAGDETIQ